jgi:hypothetical protein
MSPPAHSKPTATGATREAAPAYVRDHGATTAVYTRICWATVCRHRASDTPSKPHSFSPKCAATRSGHIHAGSPRALPPREAVCDGERPRRLRRSRPLKTAWEHGEGPIAAFLASFFTNCYRNGYRGYRFYRCGTVTVPAGQNRSDSKN